MNKSFLRLIKRIFYCLVTKKMLIGIIVLLLVLLLGSKVFAMEFSYNNVDYEYPDFTDYTNFYVGKDGNVVFIWALTDDNSFFYKSSFQMKVSGTAKSYGLSNGEWVYGETKANAVVGYASHIIGSSCPLYADYNKSSVYFQTNIIVSPPVIDPYFVSTDLELGSLNTTYITISSGTLPLYENNIDLYISTRPRGSAIGQTIYATGLNYSSEFLDSNLNETIYKIPVSVFKDFLTSGYEITYELRYRPADNQAQINTIDKTLIYTPDAETVDDIETLNNSIGAYFDKLNHSIIQQMQIQQQQVQIQQSTDDTVKDTNQFLKSQDFDNSNLNLPSSNTQDITESGLNNIFTIIYNSFTSGQAPDIVIPIPFTEKTFTIPANYLSTILEGTMFAPIKTLIELFWWYVISAYIIKDIAKKMQKLKSGEIENLENSNIKEEML